MGIKWDLLKKICVNTEITPLVDYHWHINTGFPMGTHKRKTVKPSCVIGEGYEGPNKLSGFAVSLGCTGS